MSLEFVINGEASIGAWEKPGPLQLHAPNGGQPHVDGPLGGAFPIPRPLAVVDYCRACKYRFSEHKGTPLFGSHLPEDKARSWSRNGDAARLNAE